MRYLKTYEENSEDELRDKYTKSIINKLKELKVDYINFDRDMQPYFYGGETEEGENIIYLIYSVGLMKPDGLWCEIADVEDGDIIQKQYNDISLKCLEEMCDNIDNELGHYLWASVNTQDTYLIKELILNNKDVYNNGYTDSIPTNLTLVDIDADGYLVYNDENDENGDIVKGFFKNSEIKKAKIFNKYEIGEHIEFGQYSIIKYIN